jgi:hypothetical protein
VEKHPPMRIQFFLDGPFDPIETLSVTLRNDLGDDQESITLGGEHAQYELWSLVAAAAAHLVESHGQQQRLDV